MSTIGDTILFIFIFVMEWNIKTPSHWDLDNLMVYNGKLSEIPKQVQVQVQVQPTDWEIEGDGGIDSGSFYSSGGGAASASDLGNASSSKTSADSSSKGRPQKSSLNFSTVERFSQDPGKERELGRVEDGGASHALGAIGSGEPVIGLKLGKRTYFEDVCAGGNVKPSSFSNSPASTMAAAKKSRASYHNSMTPRCQVEGCNLDLTSAKDYHRRHRVCESHSKCPRVVVAGLERRFCQQCSRFHDLMEFDEKKRSCRRRLSDHNARRRKPQPEAIQYNFGRMSSSFYDTRQQTSLLFNRVPLAHTRPAAKPTWETTFYVKPEVKKSEKGNIGGQLHLPSNDLPNAISTSKPDSDKIFSFKFTNTEVPSQGLEPPVASNLDATPDFRRALSLLSNNPWRSGNTEPYSLNHLMHVNHTSMADSAVHSVPQGLPLGSSEYWQAEHQPDGSQGHALASQINGGNHFQEFQLFKAPFESGFYSDQIN